MDNGPPVSEIYAPYTFVPSGPMALRRYRPLDRVRSYFEDGLFSYNLAEFDDEEEGRLVYHGPQEASESYQEDSGSGIRIAPGAIPGRQDMIRQKYFACCMRAGTDEDPHIWKTYISDDEMREGVALEMTFGGLRRHLPPDGSDRHVGMCWYIDRMDNEQPWMEGVTNCFLKGKKHRSQREFRVLSRYDSTELILPDDWEWPDSGTGRPEYGDNPWVKLNIDTGAITDRIILAPHADQSIRDEIKAILEDNSLDIPIVKSQLAGGPSTSEAHGSDSRARGQRLYNKGAFSKPDSTEYHQGIVDQWIAETNFDHQRVLDTVEREWFGLTTLESHRYNSSEPEVEPEDYFHEDIPYATVLNRHTGPDCCVTHVNERGKEVLSRQLDNSSGYERITKILISLYRRARRMFGDEPF